MKKDVSEFPEISKSVSKALMKTVYAGFIDPDVIGNMTATDMFVSDSILSLGSPKQDFEIDTIATDGKSIVYNPEWVYRKFYQSGITGERDRIRFMRFLLAHEAFHNILGHSIEFRDELNSGSKVVGTMCNIAADLAINDMLIKNSYDGYAPNQSIIRPGVGMFSDFPSGKDCRYYYNRLVEKFNEMACSGDNEGVSDMLNKKPGEIISYGSSEKDEEQRNDDEIPSVDEVRAGYSMKYNICKKSSNGKLKSSEYFTKVFSLPENMSDTGEKIEVHNYGKTSTGTGFCVEKTFIVGKPVDGKSNVNWLKYIASHVHKAYNEYSRRHPSFKMLGAYSKMFGTVPAGMDGVEMDDIYFVLDVSGSMDDRYMDALVEIVSIVRCANVLLHLVCVDENIQDEYIFSSRKIKNGSLRFVKNGCRIPKDHVYNIGDINKYAKTGFPFIHSGGGTYITSALGAIFDRDRNKSLVFVYSDGCLCGGDVRHCIEYNPILILVGYNYEKELLKCRHVLVDDGENKE